MDTKLITSRIISELEERGLSYFHNKIDNKLDHIAIQAFFYNVGRKLGFQTGCEKDRWDVKWITDGEPIRIEVELGSQSGIADKLNQFFEDKVTFCILVVKNYSGDYFREYLLDKSWKQEDGFGPLQRPFNTIWLLIIDIDTEKNYQLLEIDSKGWKIVEADSLKV